jgi:poly(A) polymerase
MPARPIATRIVRRIVEAGHVAYFAGGWVRDFLMQRPSDDIDIATSASVAELQALFPKTVPVGVAFGIVIVVEEGHQFEVAAFRRDRGYVDGRRPTSVEPASPEEDAQRRDFTINGMFFDPLTETIYDFVGGRKDISKGVIRAIGDPHARFLEDRLRMMRAVRYSTRFDFPIESETLQAILAHADSLLPAVAMERIWQEFKKMARFAHFDTGLVTLHRLNLLQTIFPALRGVSVAEVQQRVRAIEKFPKGAPPIAELLELFPESSLEELLLLCDTLKLSREERAFVEFYHHARSLLAMPAEWQAGLELIEWARFYAHSHADACVQIAAARLPPAEREQCLEEHHARRQLLEQAILRIHSGSPIVRAEHLLALGVSPGKKMGLLLKEAERISVNEGLEARDAILERLQKTPLWSSQ